MSYAEAVKRYEVQTDSGGPIRVDYRCAANGCPNAGSIDDSGKVRSGRCYFHFREEDATKWDAITQTIRANFDAMRNHGELSAERQALHRKQSQDRAEQWGKSA